MDINNRLFTSNSLSRGLDYFQKGKVNGLSYRDLVCKATVSGERDYKVSITFNKNGKIARATCTCPYAYQGYCKHIAATIYEMDYQKEEGFLEEEEGGEELLTDAEKFSKECYNESYKIGYKDVDDFYKRKEEEILLRQEKWSEDDLIDNISYLYTLRLPMAVGDNAYSRYLSFMTGKGYSLKVKKESFAKVYSRHSYYNFLREALKNEEFREVVNILLDENIYESGGIRSTIAYSIDDAGMYLDERNLLGLLTKTGPYDVDRTRLLKVYIKRDFVNGIEAMASLDSLSGDLCRMLADYFANKGDKERAKTFYKRMFRKSRNLPFAPYAAYWKNLTDEEKLSEYSSLRESARLAHHDKAFAVLTGSTKKSDLRGLAIEDFLVLDEEVKRQFPEDYLSVLLPKEEKNLATIAYSDIIFPQFLLLSEKYPLLLTSLTRKRNEKLLSWFTDLNRREKMLTLFRDYGLLKEMHIHPYKEEQ